MNEDKEFQLELTKIRMYYDLFARVGAFFLSVGTFLSVYYFTIPSDVSEEYRNYFRNLLWSEITLGILLISLGITIAWLKIERLKKR